MLSLKSSAHTVQESTVSAAAKPLLVILVTLHTGVSRQP